MELGSRITVGEAVKDPQRRRNKKGVVAMTYKNTSPEDCPRWLSIFDSLRKVCEWRQMVHEKKVDNDTFCATSSAASRQRAKSQRSAWADDLFGVFLQSDTEPQLTKSSRGDYLRNAKTQVQRRSYIFVALSRSRRHPGISPLLSLQKHQLGLRQDAHAPLPSRTFSTDYSAGIHMGNDSVVRCAPQPCTLRFEAVRPVKFVVVHAYSQDEECHEWATATSIAQAPLPISTFIFSILHRRIG